MMTQTAVKFMINFKTIIYTLRTKLLKKNSHEGKINKSLSVKIGTFRTFFTR